MSANAQLQLHMHPNFDPKTFIQIFWGKEWDLHSINLQQKKFLDIDLSKVGATSFLFMDESGINGFQRRRKILERCRASHPLGIRAVAFLLAHQEMCAPILDAWREILREDGGSICIDGTIFSYYREPCVAQLLLSKEGDLVLFPKSLNERFGVKDLTAICDVGQKT